MPRKRPTKKTPAKKTRVKLTPRDRKTMDSLVGLADGVVSAATKRRDPYVDIPSRTLANAKFSPRKGVLEMGGSKHRRQRFDISQKPLPFSVAIPCDEVRLSC